MAIRLGQQVIDRILGVNNQWVLNSGNESADTHGNIAATMRAILDQLKMEGFDTERGRVNYPKLKDSPTYHQYRRLAATLRSFAPSSLEGQAEKLAFWINLYNSLIVDAVITFGIKDSIWEAGKGFFRKAAYDVGGRRYSADDIEHGILRGNRRHPVFRLPQFTQDDPRQKYVIIPAEPRVHFTLVCASRSCPLITVYHAADIEEELEVAANSFINGGSVIIKPPEGKVSLSAIFKWYRRDFGGRAGIIELMLRYLRDGPEKEFLRENAGKIHFEYLEYNWSLNQY